MGKAKKPKISRRKDKVEKVVEEPRSTRSRSSTQSDKKFDHQPRKGRRKSAANDGAKSSSEFEPERDQSQCKTVRQPNDCKKTSLSRKLDCSVAQRVPEEQLSEIDQEQDPLKDETEEKSDGEKNREEILSFPSQRVQRKLEDPDETQRFPGEPLEKGDQDEDPLRDETKQKSDDQPICEEISSSPQSEKRKRERDPDESVEFPKEIFKEVIQKMDPLSDKTEQKSDVHEENGKDPSSSPQSQKLKRQLDAGDSKGLLEEPPVKIKQTTKKKRKNDYPPIMSINRKSKSRSRKRYKNNKNNETNKSNSHDVSESENLDCSANSSSYQNITTENSATTEPETENSWGVTDTPQKAPECSTQSLIDNQNVNDSELLEDTIILSSMPDESSSDQNFEHVLKMITVESKMVDVAKSSTITTAVTVEHSLPSTENIVQEQQIESANSLSIEQEAVDSLERDIEMSQDLETIQATCKLGHADEVTDSSSSKDVDDTFPKDPTVKKFNYKDEPCVNSCKQVVDSNVQQMATTNQFRVESEAIIGPSLEQDLNHAARQIEAGNGPKEQDEARLTCGKEFVENVMQVEDCFESDMNQSQNSELPQNAPLTIEVDSQEHHGEIFTNIASKHDEIHAMSPPRSFDNAKEKNITLDETTGKNQQQSDMSEVTAVQVVSQEHDRFTNISDDDLLQEMTALIGDDDHSFLKDFNEENSTMVNNNDGDEKMLSEKVSALEDLSTAKNDDSSENLANEEFVTQDIEESVHKPDEDNTRIDKSSTKTKAVADNVALVNNLGRNSSLLSKKTVKFKSKGKNSSRGLKKTPKKQVKSQPLNQYIYNENDELSCRICLQKLDSVKFYTESYDHGLAEDQAILDSHLQLFNGNEEEVAQEDLRASNKLTNFSIYCKNGHLCPIDSGLVQKGMEIFFSGYIKPIFSDNSLEEGGVPVKDCGPIVHWWITGFDLGEQPILGITTEIGDYFLMQPSEEYFLFMPPLLKKIFLSKAVIECLIYDPFASYEDLLSKLQSETSLNVTEDILLDHARFICDQVISFDETARPGEPLLVVAPCIRRLIDLAGIKFSRQDPHTRMVENQKDLPRRTVPKNGRRSASALSDELIDRLLPQELSVGPSVVPAKGRCKVCERCCRPPCQNCDACTTKRPDECFQRRCFFYEIQEANDEDWRNSFDHSKLKVRSSIAVYKDAIQNFQCFESKLSWSSPPCGEDENGNIYYKTVTVDNVKISAGDFVTVRSINKDVPVQVMRIAYLWQNSAGIAQFHGNYLWSGRDTVLGRFSAKRELFSINNCQNLLLTSVVDKVYVDTRSLPKCWDEWVLDETVKTLFCHKSYDPKSGCFADLAWEDASSTKSDNSLRFCRICEMDHKKLEFHSPRPFGKIDESDGKVRYRGIKYKGEAYIAGSAVYLKPKSIYFKYPMLVNPRATKEKIADETVYPEYFRKILQPKTDLQLDTSAPLNIGFIKEIVMCSNKLSLRVKKLYRPENTHKKPSFNRKFDFKMLFWSHEECTVPFECVIGKCYLTHEKNVEDAGDWSRRGPDRFYFSQVYEDKQLISVESHRYLGAKETHEFPRDSTYMPKLATLDLFAGCGGLSCGLQQSGVADTHWAIESNAAAASTYKLNSPHTNVFVEECDVFLKRVLKGETKLDFQTLPRRGDVQLLCATIPCKSLRAIDSVSAFKSSSIATFVSFCDYYRPLLFVIEADERLTKKSLILKLTLACFVNMGYQVSFDLLQVGCYGVPQNCRRSVILGAAPGQKLPQHPRPLHSLPKTLCASGVVVDGKKYTRPSDRLDFAPYRCVTVQDAIDDLLMVKTHSPEDYCGEPVTCYQRMMRSSMLEPTLSDHVWKNLDPLVQSRIARIPQTKNSNWCDLPNIQIQLEDGRVANKLKYPYEIQTPTGVRRGVCKCSEGEKCEPRDKQDGCLIPWHLAHSADDRNEHWVTLYSRIPWDGLSSGGMANPEPLGEQGPVLHPSQNRVVSVRECARFQGFADDFILDRNLSIHDKYRLIGEATSPLFALAIGNEIARSLTHQSK